MIMDDAKVLELLAKAEKDATWQSYLLSKLATIENPSRWLKELIQRGYFDPAKNPPVQKVGPTESGYTVPYWPMLGYLENVALQNNLNPSDETSSLLIGIIDPIIDYRVEGKRIENFRTDSAIIKVIFNLPVERIRRKHIAFVSTVLYNRLDPGAIAPQITQTSVPYLLKNSAKELLLELMRIILNYKKDDKSYFSKYVSILGDYWLDDLLNKNAKQIFEICGLDLYPIGTDIIYQIIRESDRDEFSSIITIEDSSQNLRDHYLTHLVFFIRDLLIFSGSDKIREIVGSLLKEKYPIMRRLGIHLIGTYYEALKGLFWDWAVNPIEDYMIKHELYEFFLANSSKFSQDEIGKIIQWLQDENLSRFKEHYKTESDLKKAIAYHEKEWLSALLPSKDKRVSNLYEEYDAINPAKLEHPGYLVWSSGAYISEPESMDLKIANKSNEEISEFLTSLRPEVNDNEDRFRATVSKHPQQFSSDLLPFLTIPRAFQYALLSGLASALREEKNLDWPQTIQFIQSLISDMSFWQEKQEKTPHYRVSIAKGIADLIGFGVEIDAFKSDKSLQDAARKALLVLAEHNSSEFDVQFSLDLVTSVLNSPRGAIYMAMARFAVQYEKTGDEKPWISPIKDHFTRCICGEIVSSIELYVTLGTYLVSIYYNLDRNWIHDNISRILPKDEENYWNAAFASYLFAASRVYKEIYMLLKNDKHYSKALGSKFSEGISKDRIADHIAVGYINDYEEITDSESLISQLISRNDPELILPIINLLWRATDKLTEKQRSQIILLWEKLVESLKHKEDDPAVSKILAGFFRWINIPGKLDDRIVKLLKISAKHVKEDTWFVIDDLLKNVEKTPHEVGDIFLEMLQQENYPYYRQDEIQKLVGMLYDRGEKSLADKICEMYWEKQYFFLRELYEAHN